MKKTTILSGIALLTLSAFTTHTLLDYSTEEVADRNNEFAINLYQQITKAEKNEFISPYSISTALAMTYLGSGGETSTCMQEVLKYGENSPAFHQAFSDLQAQIEAINKVKGLEMNVANRLWGNINYNFNDDFIQDVKKYYGAGLERVDYEDAEKAVEIINTWVEQQTNDRIKDLVPVDAISKDTRLVLTNAIYFNAAWGMEFSEDETYEQAFYKTKDDYVMKEFMHHYGWTPTGKKDEPLYQYAENGEVQLLSLPYADNKASMLIALPKDKEGLEKVVNGLSAKKYERWLSSLKLPEHKLNVTIPKWKNTADYELGKQLKEMGMSLAFSDGANFFGMTDLTKKEDPLKISKVIHKAFVEVAEEGTEAAAATAVVMDIVTSSVGPTRVEPVINFIADHPFLYIIKDNETGSILFMGQVTEPEFENDEK